MLRQVSKWMSGIALAAVLIPASAQAQTSGSTTESYKVVEHGKSLQIAFYDSLDPTCHSMGLPQVSLLTAPTGGEIQTKPGLSYSNFPTTNSRSVCNTRKTPSTLVFYRANNDYTGWDTVEIETVFADGEARKFRYLIQVR